MALFGLIFALFPNRSGSIGAASGSGSQDNALKDVSMKNLSLRKFVLAAAALRVSVAIVG